MFLGLGIGIHFTVLSVANRWKDINTEIGVTVVLYLDGRNRGKDRGMSIYKGRGAEIAWTLPNWIHPECDCADFAAIGAKIKQEFRLEE